MPSRIFRHINSTVGNHHVPVRENFSRHTILFYLLAMWASLTNEEVEELLIVLRTTHPSSKSVIKLVEALQQHPSRVAPPPSLGKETTKVDPSRPSEALGNNSSSRKEGICCRNGKKVVEIRKAPPIGDTSVGEAPPGQIVVLSGGGTQLTDDVEGSDSRDTESDDSDYESPNSKKKRRRKRSTTKEKDIITNTGSKKRHRTSDDTETRGNKWRTDGETPTVPPEAEAFIFSLASVQGQLKEGDMDSFLPALHPASSHLFPSSSHSMDGTFAGLVARCKRQQKNTKITEFHHMVSLVILAHYLNRQVSRYSS